jgi:hypothetical protein
MKCRMVPHKLDMPIFVDGPVNNTISSPLIMLPGMIPHEHSRIVMPTRRRLQRQINQQTRFDPDLIDANYNTTNLSVLVERNVQIYRVLFLPF